MPVGAIGNIRAKSLYVHSDILSRTLTTKVVSNMPQLTTLQRISLPKVVNGTMVYDKEFDDLFVFRQGQWTSLIFTSVNPDEVFEIGNETPSTSTSDGALTVAGGTGIGGSLNVGGSIDTNQGITIGDDSESIDELSGALVVSGGAGVGGSINVGGSVSINNSLSLGEGTSSYTFPEKGNNGEFLRLENGELIFDTVDVNNNVTAEFPFTADDKIVKTKGDAIIQTGVTINSSNDMSGVNNLTIGTSSTYTMPNTPGLSGQFLMQSTGGAIVFTTASFSPNVVNSPGTFGTDNVLLRSDGTGRDAQSTGIIVSDNNEMTIIGTTQSTSTSTGSLTVQGGLGVSKNVNIGGDLTINTNANINVLTLGTGTNTYTFPTEIGNIGQILSISTSGGLTFVNQAVSAITVNSTNVFGTNNVLLKSDGIDRNLKTTSIVISDSNDMSNLNSLSISGTATSISSTTGSLIVSGGVGIGENLNVSRNITFDGRLTGRVRDVTSDTTLDDDYILNVSPSGTSGAIITLPNIQNYIYTGVTYMIIKENSNTVTITTDNPIDKITSGGSEVTSLVLTGLTDERITLVSNGKKWVTM